jgi:hypothetical protein
MKKNGSTPPKRPNILKLILEDVRDDFQRTRLEKHLARAGDCLKLGDLQPMQQLAHLSVGRAWLALADFADHRPEDPALATDSYRKALECKDWFNRPSRLDEEYDRRRFLGIGTSQDLRTLVKEWKSARFLVRARNAIGLDPCMWARRTADLREAWWWVAVAEARWGQCRDVALPTLSAGELHEHLVKSVRERRTASTHEKAKEYGMPNSSQESRGRLRPNLYRDFPQSSRTRLFSSSQAVFEIPGESSTWQLLKTPRETDWHLQTACVGGRRGPRYEPLGRAPFVQRGRLPQARHRTGLLPV